MKKFLTVLCFALALSFNILGAPVKAPHSDPARPFRIDPYVAALVFHVYEPADTIDTPAPAGYKPVYVSHIGRHGSRYHQTSWAKTMTTTRDRFNAYAEAGALTELGLKVKDALNRLVEAHQGKFGDLSPLGADEHRQIARRLYKRVPDVFNDSSRKDVVCVNTGSKRVIASQESFLSSLCGLQPGLNVTRFSSTVNKEKSAKVKGSELPREEVSAFIKPLVDEARKNGSFEKFNASRLEQLLFVDGKKPKGYYPKVITNLRVLFAVREGIPDELFDVYSIFTPEELYSLWCENEIQNFVNMGNCTESKHLKPLKVGGEIVRNMIVDADEALAGGTRAADLRFSHDAYVQPALSFIAGTGNEEHSIKEWPVRWFSGRSSSMASNIQLIFYRSCKKKDILVKVLHNEKEIELPGLKSVKGPYYKWSDFKEYYLKKLETD